jgi:hypothetical protein
VASESNGHCVRGGDGYGVRECRLWCQRATVTDSESKGYGVKRLTLMLPESNGYGVRE